MSGYPADDLAGAITETEDITRAVLEIAARVGVPAPPTNARDALIRLRALLRDREDTTREPVT